jgi:hypothetical protein
MTHYLGYIQRTLKVYYTGMVEQSPLGLGAARAPARTSIVEVRAPLGIVAGLEIVAVRLLRECAHPLRCFQVVGAVDHLNVLEVARLAEPFLREVPTAHLRRCVHAVGLRVHHLPTPLNHRRTVGEVGEEERWPVAENIVLAELHPPVALFWVLHKLKYKEGTLACETYLDYKIIHIGI